MRPGAQLPQPWVPPVPAPQPAPAWTAAPPPRPASLLRRGVGWVIDYAIVMVPGAALVLLAVVALVHGLPVYLGTVATEVGVSHLVSLIAHHGDAEGLTTVASHEWSTFVRPLTGALLAIPLIQFGYQVVSLSWRGRTVGKVVTGIRVDPATPRATFRRAPLALRRALITTTVESGLVSVALAVITIGYLSIGAALWVVGVVAFWVNLSTILGPRRRTVADRLAGTMVVHTAVFASVVGRAAELGRRMSGGTVDQGPVLATAIVQPPLVDVAASAAPTTADPTTADPTTADPAAVAGRPSGPVQRAIEWQPSQQAQALGAAGVDRARQLGQQATDRARLVGGRAQQLWREQQARRGRPDPPPPPADPADPPA